MLSEGKKRVQGKEKERKRGKRKKGRKKERRKKERKEEGEEKERKNNRFPKFCSFLSKQLVFRFPQQHYSVVIDIRGNV